MSHLLCRVSAKAVRQRRPRVTEHIPLGRIGMATDLAPMALAVLSNKIWGYVTGAAITVDGGIALTNWFDPPEL